jgi:geranylgeranyl reductase family protein
MNKYYVIIVGAGPAGLRCAEILSKSSLSVLLLEKGDVFGNKVCAGGITRKDLAVIDIPDRIIEHKVTQTAIFSRKRASVNNAPEPIVFTLKRIDLGRWQKMQINTTNVEIRTNAKVTDIKSDYVVVNDLEKISYTYLVGADGYASIVRKYLKLPQEKQLIGIQYTVPDPNLDPRLEIHLYSKYFKSWYAWVFPHENSFVVGCVCDPKMMSAKKLKNNFHAWLKEKGISIKDAVYHSAPISYDYRGFKFGNIFLAGEAGGFASGLTGEGIYQSLVSGEVAAKSILDDDYVSEEINSVIRYNAIQLKIMKFLYRSGIFRKYIYELIVILMNNQRVKNKIHSSFS